MRHMICQAARLGGVEARSLVPRLLHFLMVDPLGLSSVQRVFKDFRDNAGDGQGGRLSDIPTWVWLPWIPQLLTSFQRPEVYVARRIVASAAVAHPQYSYWHLRPGMISLKEAAVRAVQDAKAQAKQQHTQQMLHKIGEADTYTHGRTISDSTGAGTQNILSMKSQDEQQQDKPADHHDNPAHKRESAQIGGQPDIIKPLEVRDSDVDIGPAAMRRCALLTGHCL